MGNCKNCKHWQLKEIGPYFGPKTKATYGACDGIDYGDKPANDTQAAIFADADDDSNLTAELITGPEFGCVLFCQKEPCADNAPDSFFTD